MARSPQWVIERWKRGGIRLARHESRERDNAWLRAWCLGDSGMSRLAGKRVLLIVSGGIAAFKVPELIRLLRRAGCGVTCVLTAHGRQFVTALTLQALSESKVYTDLFSLTDENEMGHIQLS